MRYSSPSGSRSFRSIGNRVESVCRYCSQVFSKSDISLSRTSTMIATMVLRGCLKKIDKIAYINVLGVFSLFGSLKSRDFEQNLVWFVLISQF